MADTLENKAIRADRVQIPHADLLIDAYLAEPTESGVVVTMKMLLMMLG